MGQIDRWHTYKWQKFRLQEIITTTRAGCEQPADLGPNFKFLEKSQNYNFSLSEQ